MEAQLPFKALVLAAGLGTRMRSTLPKVLHPVLGWPMVAFAVELALGAGAEEVGVVVGHGREEIFEILRRPGLQFSWHYFVKPDIEVEGDCARGRWDILSPCTSKEGRALWMAGVEHDEYVREGGDWLHARMQLEVVFMASYEKGWARTRAGAGDQQAGKPDRK